MQHIKNTQNIKLSKIIEPFTEQILIFKSLKYSLISLNNQRQPIISLSAWMQKSTEVEQEHLNGSMLTHHCLTGTFVPI